MLLGYARVSKGEQQDTRMQETALRAAGVERIDQAGMAASVAGGLSWGRSSGPKLSTRSIQAGSPRRARHGYSGCISPRSAACSRASAAGSTRSGH